MELPLLYAVLIMIGMALVVVSSAFSLALASDTYRSCAFYTASKTLNAVTIGYAAFIFGSVLWGVFRPL